MTQAFLFVAEFLMLLVVHETGFVIPFYFVGYPIYNKVK